MAFPGRRKSASQKQAANSSKELQKLRRVDLLELLLDEMRDNEQKTAAVDELTALTDRLKAKLDAKDEQIERLKSRLDEKDAKIAQLKATVGDAPAAEDE